jgi:signal transduction histidine kinase
MKLLNKTTRPLLIYSAVILVIAIPFFYFLIQRYVVEDVDESLAVQKEHMMNRLETAQADPVAFLETFEPDIHLTPLSSFRQHDTMYTVKIYDKISKENIPYRTLESNIMVGNIPYTIRIRNSLLDSADLIRSIVTIMVVLILLTGAGFLIINRLTAKKIWRPFYETLIKLQDYQIEKNEPIRFSKTGIAEFTELNTTIIALTQRNQQIYQSQKEFTENASHELQTPLAILQAKLELLMQTTPLKDEQAGLISDLADTSQRLNRLNKSLLLLSRIENNLFLDKERISVKQLTGKLVEQYQFQIEKRNIRVYIDYADDDTIIANRTLIEILFSNLLSNAIRYNHENGSIYLSSKENIFTVRNTGINTPLNPDKIFGRFHKESTDSQSSGLGLAIAQKIVKLYNHELSYSFSGNMHGFSFRLTNKPGFPVI